MVLGEKHGTNYLPYTTGEKLKWEDLRDIFVFVSYTIG